MLGTPSSSPHSGCMCRHSVSFTADHTGRPSSSHAKTNITEGHAIFAAEITVCNCSNIVVVNLVRFFMENVLFSYGKFLVFLLFFFTENVLFSIYLFIFTENLSC